jgi:hypothetical protein
MADVKTKPTHQSVTAFLKTIEPQQKRSDSRTLLALFEEATGEKAVMWGPSIIGFGVYQIKKGKQVNEWPLVAFSPRKQNLTLYILNKDEKEDASWKGLGKYHVSGVCLHINRLADVDVGILKKLIRKSFEKSKLALTT